MNSCRRKGGIIGTGRYAPARIVDNAEIEADMGVGSGWIERRTGIRSRRYAAPDQALTDIAAPAAEMALESAGITRSKIGLTLLATSTPDHLLPPSAPLLAHKLALPNSGAIDMAGACAGFLYALAMADAYSRIHGIHVLVVAANILSRRINSDERASRVLFADAAGAVIVAPPVRPGQGVLAADLTSDGSGYDLIKINAGGSRTPFAPDIPLAEFRMAISDGRAVFTKAVSHMTASAGRALEKAKLDVSAIDCFVPHQANVRIIDAVASSLGLSRDKTALTLGEFGNSSAATIPFSLSSRDSEQPLQEDDMILFSAIGAGLVGGSVVYRL